MWGGVGRAGLAVLPQRGAEGEVGRCEIRAVDCRTHHVRAAAAHPLFIALVLQYGPVMLGCRYQPRTVFAGSVSLQFAPSHAAEQAAALAQVINT